MNAFTSFSILIVNTFTSFSIQITKVYKFDFCEDYGMNVFFTFQTTNEEKVRSCFQGGGDGMAPRDRLHIEGDRRTL